MGSGNEKKNVQECSRLLIRDSAPVTTRRQQLRGQRDNSSYRSCAHEQSFRCLQLRTDEAFKRVNTMENDPLASFMCQNR